MRPAAGLMCVVIGVLCMASSLAAAPASAPTKAAEPATTTAQTWVSFDAATGPGVRFETKIPAQARLVAGPEGHKAVSVTVPDMSLDEKACAFDITLPQLKGDFNALRLWLKGGPRTRRVEVVVRGDQGSYGADLPLEPEWRQVTLSALNTQPFFGTTGGRLDPNHARELRLCFGEWLGNTGKNQQVSVGPIIAVRSPAFAPPGPVRTITRPHVPLPLQPFTVDLLDRERGQWRFIDALGQHLYLDGPVVAYAFPEGVRQGSAADLRLGYLCCDPEFPDDLGHAVLKVASPSRTVGGAAWFRIEEPYFAASVEATPVGQPGTDATTPILCRVTNITLGPAVTGDRYVAGLYIMAGSKAWPLWLAPDDDTTRLNPRLLTDRVGGVFAGGPSPADGEPVRVTFATYQPRGAIGRLRVEARDYATGKIVWRGEVKTDLRGGRLDLQTVTVPLASYGVFEVSARAAGLPTATCRVCRVPRPDRLEPSRSGVGINIFQQQIWWYAYQVPLMAEAGVHWIRPWLAWENTWATQEPERGKWDFRALDSALRRMEAYRIGYADILFRAPSWVAGDAADGVPPMDKMGLWGDYVGHLLRRYRGRIRYYEVWNEPDGMWPEATRHSGAHYLAMLKATWAAAKKADPGCVLLGLSHAGYEAWLENVGRLGAGNYFDTATIHTYAAPHDFMNQVDQRRAILDRYGMGNKPVWVNEFGKVAYDFSPAYSAKYQCSERKQAATLTELYALALSVDPGAKAFWFCTYDPRDPAHQSQWTGDAAIGVLYLGFLPKLSYAALAGVSKKLDGRACLGRQNYTRDLHQVSFGGPAGSVDSAAPVAVVWADDASAEAKPLAATRLGCLPGEHIVVRDLYTNQLAAGRAADLRVDLSRGPVYIEGSRQMAAVARAETAAAPSPREVFLAPGGAGTVELPVPAAAKIAVEVQQGVPVSAAVKPGPGGKGQAVVLSAPSGVKRTSGMVRLRVSFGKGVFGLAAPHEVTRDISVTVGQPDLIHDGGFFLGNLNGWTPERTSAFAWDPKVGHAAPGSLRLDAPFDRRLVYWGIGLDRSRPLKLRLWVKTKDVTGCLATLNLAIFDSSQWLKTLCLATTGPAGKVGDKWRTVDAYGRIPTGTAGWTLVEATAPPDAFPPGGDSGAFFIDVSGGGKGRIWIDDLDLWQPAEGAQ